MSSDTNPTHGTYGVLAEFDSPAALLEAAERVRESGYTRTDAFTPFPVHGLDEAIGFKENKVAKIILGGGITGLLGGFGLQYYCQVISYPINIGGRPYYSWVAWIPPMFETTILIAALSAVVGMEPQEYQMWLAAGGNAGSSPMGGAASGEQLFKDSACITCHTEDGKGRGPSLVNVAGNPVKLTNGQTVIADDNYLRESILNSQAKVVEGYQPVMPAFQGMLSEDQVMGLIAYIKSLKK